MECDEKSLRELLASSHGITAVRFILDQLTMGDPLVVTKVDGAVMHLKNRHEVESLLVTLGCPELLIRQMNRFRCERDRDVAGRLARVRKRWEKTRAEHLLIMQKAFSIAGKTLTLAQQHESLNAPPFTSIPAKRETSTPAGPPCEAPHNIAPRSASRAG